MSGLLIWGASSQARLLLQYADVADGMPLFLFDASREKPAFQTRGEFTSEVNRLPAIIAQASHFMIAIGGEHGLARTQIYDHLRDAGLSPVSVVHSTAHIEDTSSIGDHHHVFLGARVHHFVKIGDCAILNTASVIDHECELGRGVHVMGGAQLAGRVSVGDFASIGTNATILPDIRIGQCAYVGAGAVVTRDVPDFAVVAGNPAKIIGTQSPKPDQALAQIGKAKGSR